MTITVNTGVYKITNLVNGKVYIGSAARSFQSRLGAHKQMLRRNGHDNKYLQNAWNKYGEASFNFSIIARCDPEDCVRIEQHFINKFKSASFKFGYNRSPTAGSNLGCKLSAETRKKFSARQLGVIMPKWVREKISKANKGKKFSEEHIKHIGDASRGRIHSAETKAKIKASCNKAEVKAKISATNTGRKHTEETRKKMSIAGRGRPKTAAHRAAISAAHKARRPKIIRKGPA